MQIPDEYLNANGMADVAARYESVYGGLTPDKAHIMRQICEAFTLAYLSYVSLNDKTKDSANRIYIAGTYADMFLRKLEYVEQLFGLDEAKTEEKLQSTGEWLEKKGWICLPKYRDMEGRMNYVTAHGMIFDMKANSSAMHRLRVASQETARGSRTNAPKTRDDKSIASDDEPLVGHPHSFERREQERMARCA